MRILVVEDNPRLAELISEGLAAAGYVSDVAFSVGDAESFLDSVEYDLIVLDLWLPDGCGRTVLRGLRGRGRSTPVLVATARIDIPIRVETLEEGADDFLGKPFCMEELIARVRAILRRPPQLAQSILAISNLVFDLERMIVEIDGSHIDFSRREMNALATLMRAGGSLVPRRKLEAALYSFNEEVTPNALEAVVSRLRKRLENSGAAVTVTAMRGVGYILSERM
ncbi:MAG: response regulator [Methylocystis sp.]|uniref:response regulator n=1 Tax=Methylocystis sp. TaxID=1911079 RepID=UPI003DA1FED3